MKPSTAVESAFSPVEMTDVQTPIHNEYLKEINPALLDDGDVELVEQAEATAIYVEARAKEEYELAIENNLVFMGEMALLTHHIETEGTYVGIEQEQTARRPKRFFGSLSIAAFNESLKHSAEKVTAYVKTSAAAIAQNSLLAHTTEASHRPHPDNR